jgi:hypothetical protein
VLPQSSPRHRKVHVSLPADLYERIEIKSELTGSPFSTTLAAILRRALEDEEQARLEEALRLDGEDNEAFARSVEPITAWVLGNSATPPRP